MAERFQVALEASMTIAEILCFIGCYGEIEYSLDAGEEVRRAS